MRIHSLCTAIMATTLCLTGVRARTIVVSGGGRSIQKAINEADEGDTVFVKKGIYNESVVLSDRLVLLGEDVDQTILRGNRRKPVVRLANNCVLSGFTIAQGGVGVLSENTNAVIEQNIIKENAKSGIHCLISLPHVRNNIIAGNEWTGVFCELISFGSRSAIEHNIIADNGNSGIMLSNKSVVLVQNNVFAGNKEFGIFVTESAKRSRIIYNAFFNNRKAFNNFAVIDESNIAKDPQFPPLPAATFMALAGHDSPLRGLGKDAATIGLAVSAAQRGVRADSDKDGIDDIADQCMEIPEDLDGFEDTDGCPDFDNDFDGIYDNRDSCPDDPEDFDGFEDTDGCPDPDNDKDGVLDSVDKCPNSPETFNGYMDDDGCPDEVPAR